MNIDKQIINLIFDAGKGEVDLQSREATQGEPIGSMPVPTRTGYTFDGWYLDDELVTAQTVLQSEEDVRLVARWTKQAGTKRTSNLKKQKIAIAVVSVLILLLTVALIVINSIGSVTTVEDVYFDADGNKLTQKYYIKKVDGSYGMFDADGVRMNVNKEGYHIAMSGNQYSIDATTGECKLYALVDSFDASIGELLGFNARVMMYPQIEQTDIYSIEVKNDNEVFTVLRHPNGTAYLKGTENQLNVLNDNSFANLAVACGYTLTVQKLDLNDPAAPRKPDGSIDYSAYGLAEEDTPIVFTITKRAYTEDGKTCAATGAGSSYTVSVGSVTISGAGYYAKMEGREAVYILSPTVAPTLVQPSEAMVSATVIYPMNVNNHLMVEDFILETGTLSVNGVNDFLGTNEFDPRDKQHVVDFSYWDLAERENSMYSMHPFTTNMDIMDGYFLNSTNISDALSAIYMAKASACVKNGITNDAIKEYLLGGESQGKVYHLSFRYNVLEREAILTRRDGETDQSFQSRVLTKAKVLMKEYQIESSLLEKLTYDSAIVALESMGIYLEDGILYDKATHLYNIYSYCAGLLIDLGYDVEKVSESAALNLPLLQEKVHAVIQKLEATGLDVHYDAEKQAMYVVNRLLISEQRDGNYYVAVSLYDMIVSVERHHFAFLDWDADSWYGQFFTTIEIAYMTDLEIVVGDKNYVFKLDNSATDQSSGPASTKLKVSVDTGEGSKPLDYVIHYDTVSDTGISRVESLDALTNFRNFYQKLQYISFEGSMDESELSKLGISMEECKSLPDSACDMIIYYRAVDLRGNSVAKVIRFYTYSGHTFVTIELVDAFDQNGNPTTDWRSQSSADNENANGAFYVNSNYLNILKQDLVRVTRGESKEDIVVPQGGY